LTEGLELNLLLGRFVCLGVDDGARDHLGIFQQSRSTAGELCRREADAGVLKRPNVTWLAANWFQRARALRMVVTLRLRVQHGEIAKLLAARA
jgi:hypothetical protein